MVQCIVLLFYGACGCRIAKESAFLQLGLESSLLLGGVEDRVELGGHHDGTLDLDLSGHEQLLSVGLTLSEGNEIIILEINGDIGLQSLDGSLVHCTVAGLEIEGPGGGLTGIVLDVELEDTLDLLDLILALGLGEILEVLVDLGEESRGLEAFDGES